MFCREHVVQLHREQKRIHDAGAELIVIGNGSPSFITGFREVTSYRGPLYTDPSLKTYTAAGLRRGVGTLLNPKVLLHGVRSLARGNMQGRTQGDPTQQGGVLVVLPSGRVAFQHVSNEAGDNLPAVDAVEALEAAVQKAA